jgi:hypothetical protein
MAREKKAIDEKVANEAASRIERTIKTTEATLYATEVSGNYPDFGMTPEQFRAAAFKRIERLLEEGEHAVDQKTLSALKQEYKDGRKEFQNFLKLNPRERDRVLELVKKQGVPIDEAYRLRAGTSRS